MRIGTKSLVHDIAKRRIEVLGAEVNRQGDARPQRDRLEDFMGRLHHRLDHLADDGDVIVGISNYDTRFRKRGRYAFDGEDVLRQLDQFVNHWDTLNRAYVENFLGDIQEFLGHLGREHAIDLGLRGLGLTHTWVAYIPTGQRFVEARPGGQTGEAVQRLRLPSGRRLLSTMGTLFERDPLEVQPEPEDRNRQHVPSDLGEDELDVLLDGLADLDLGEMDLQPDSDAVGASSTVPMSSNGSDLADDDDSLSTEAAVGDSGEVEGGSSEGSSLGGSSSSYLHQEGLVDSYHSFNPFDSTPPEGERYEAVSDFRSVAQGRRASSPGALRTRWIYLDARSIDHHEKTRVGLVRLDEPMPPEKPIVQVFEGRYASAVTAVVLDELHRAANDGIELLMVRMGSDWLAKALVQRTRRFRQPGLFDRILVLHEVVTRLGVELVLGGRCPMPSALHVALKEPIR